MFSTEQGQVNLPFRKITPPAMKKTTLVGNMVGGQKAI